MSLTANMEGWILIAVRWLRFAVEITGAMTIATGSFLCLFRFVKALFTARESDYGLIRLTLARYLGLALEFQLGADILSTAIAPGWEEIGKLGAIAVIRTGLNYFLTKELNEKSSSEYSTGGNKKTIEINI